MASGTQATDGIDCRPESSGPKDSRIHLNRATSRPIGTAMTIAIAKPIRPRDRLVQMVCQACPPCSRRTSSSPTAAGEGSITSGLTPSR